MEHFELVEKLRQKANVSYEEARNALEENNWDLLDALVSLESQGKIHQEGSERFTTRKEPQPEAKQEQDLRSVFTKVFDYLGDLLSKAGKMHMDIKKRGKLVFSLPLLAAILLLVFGTRWIFLALLAIGLFLDYRYSFRGHQAADTMNKAMDKAAQTAESLKGDRDKPQQEE